MFWGRSRTRSKRMPSWLLVFFTLLLGVGGGFLLRQARGDQQAFDAIMDHGTETTAAMDATVSYDSKNRPSYAATLSWVDRLGEKRTFGPTHISQKFWNSITRGGVVTVKQTKMRYLDTDPTARPVIIADADERRFQDKFGVWAGIGGMVLGGIAALVLVRRMTRLG
jgi:hypothetical protein